MQTNDSKQSFIHFSHDTASQIIVDDADDDDADIPLHPDKTIIHVTTLDELVQVSNIPLNIKNMYFEVMHIEFYIHLYS